MNTISSLFNFIGNLIGANPNTLTTTSKTLVGAINEVKAMHADYIETTSSSGNWKWQKYHSGRVEAVFKGSISYTATTASGDLWKGSTTLAIPNGIFGSTPNAVTATINNVSSATGSVGIHVSTTSSTELGVMIFRTTKQTSSTSITATIRVSYYPS